MTKFGLPNADCTMARPRSACAHPFRNPQSTVRMRHALTLIELLVVIVILTTLVGGVIPILSPNNDTRKIRAAARGLQGYITQAQAQAARTGRPHGIAFRESAPESGVALEVFGLEVPPPFAGFSTESRVRLITPAPTFPKTTPGIVERAQFVLATAITGDPVPDDLDPDFVPPSFLKLGDVIRIDGYDYRLVDRDLDGNGSYSSAELSAAFGAIYTLENGNKADFAIAPVDIATVPIQNYSLSGNGLLVSVPKEYKMVRQPTNSSESPYQLPSGIVIDMQASVAEGSDATTVAYNRFPLGSSLFTDRSAIPAGDPVPTDAVGIMFSPTGAVDRLIINGAELVNASRIVLLLGRIENGGIDPATINLSASNAAPWTAQGNDKNEDVQERINWLNLDSRLLSIVPSNGRAVVSEPAFVDTLLPGNRGGNDGETAELQIEAAHGFAHGMSTVGGN